MSAIKNIAFKCTYNNGNEGVYVGFEGACSDEIIKNNIVNSRAWCNNEDCDCKHYYDRGFKGARPKYPCYESCLFIDWEYGAGWDHNGVRGNVHRRILGTDEGKIAIITTRFPGDSEADRKIVGLYRIGNVSTEEGAESMVSADDEFRIRFPAEEVNELFFWDFYKNENSNNCTWSQGLFRYMTDLKVAQILLAVRKTINSETEKIKIDKLFKEVQNQLGVNSIPEPQGARKKNYNNRTNIITMNRKYGSCGEGIEHKRLKEWIAKHPEALELFDVSKVEVEQHRFLSGDLPDIVFSFGKEMYAVIEIETIDPFPGAFQALKYKSLMCAEVGVPITSDKVRAFLVAWKIPEEVKKFCIKYGIEAIIRKI